MGMNRDTRTLLQRWLPHPLLTLVLIILWLLLLNAFTMAGLVMAVFLGVVIPIITSHFWPDRPPIRAYGKAMAFMAVVVWDVILANIQVARLIVFRRAEELQTRWVTVPITLKSPEAIAVLAGTITMTPGTISSDISADGCSLLVHCLDAPDVEQAVLQIKDRYEARLKEIFP
jgi:multicomponent K+:H+ antiporter subunit E